MIEVKLEHKPIPVSLVFQPVYKIVMLMAILKYGCASPHKATFLKLHLYMWSLRSPQNHVILKRIKARRRQSIVPWNYELGLERTVTLALVNNYCSKEIVSNDLQIKLLPEGNELLEKVEYNNFFAEDIQRIKELGVIPQNQLVQANANWKM